MTKYLDKKLFLNATEIKILWGPYPYVCDRLNFVHGSIGFVFCVGYSSHRMTVGNQHETYLVYNILLPCCLKNENMTRFVDEIITEQIIIPKGRSYDKLDEFEYLPRKWSVHISYAFPSNKSLNVSLTFSQKVHFIFQHKRKPTDT